METAKTGMRHPWWQPGVFASAPAIFLWVCAQFPADMLGNLFHAGTSPDSLTHVGDTLFVVGWTASGVLLWHGRRRIEPQATEAASSGTAVDTVPQGEAAEAHGLAALRRNMVRRLERLRHPIPLH
ncbi:hypothetical protein B7R78_0009930 [Ralstonia solanacearum]|uniref:Transmembrane protein n=1 Tax=Ralstonia solanacearum K60 TaxID=1091042 RepID=A0AAP7ZL55_RALSL|nr:hypothetical protein [Ralstonia solanacearum]MBT1537442.1 hypothetical protein [Ralstonia solanacearum]OYQ12610.1 hypothetical protein B7R77_04655 [Ralstonia solanacearum K60]QOK82947.1 hypothetical protein HF906_12805 [Ralstonia solanacearum]RIJ87713.1 hypothetical protein RSP822_04065 [Ralstonia solanacearum]CCF96874.1 conserved hypothetical protein [Ralstonia solanacearum K60]